jgi:predicted NodU family carbamoyl transferase
VQAAGTDHSGGCGLNCDWNAKWKETGLFPEPFVPSVANDSGSAIGTAIDAQFRFTGAPKVEWAHDALALRETAIPDMRWGPE